MKEHETKIDAGTASAMGVREWPGYHGMFTRAQAPGAIPNETPIKKVWSEPGDLEPVGKSGKVLGSLAVPPGFEPPAGAPTGVLFVYWVEWDSLPKHAVFIIDKKIGRR